MSFEFLQNSSIAIDLGLLSEKFKGYTKGDRREYLVAKRRKPSDSVAPYIIVASSIRCDKGFFSRFEDDIKHQDNSIPAQHPSL